jgi:predicted DNA-binding ribbon-helix-helix protein
MRGTHQRGQTATRRAVSGRKTSVSLEEPFWQVLQDIATVRGISRPALIGLIAEKRTERNLSSALRVFVLEHFRAAAREARERM